MVSVGEHLFRDLDIRSILQEHLLSRKCFAFLPLRRSPIRVATCVPHTHQCLQVRSKSV